MIAGKLSVPLEGQDFRPFRAHVAPRQNPVNPGARAADALETVERGQAFAHPLAGGDPGVLEESVSGQNVIRFVLAGDRVEIAHDQHRQGGVPSAHPLANEFRALFARRLDAVIKVRVEQVKLAVGLAVPELHPRHHAGQRGSPGFRAHDLRGVGQPEMIKGQRLQPGLAIKHRHELAPAAAVPPQADPIKLGQVAGQVLELAIHPFLGADDIRRRLAQQFAHQRTPRRPGVWRGVARKTQVVTHHPQRGGRRSGGGLRRGGGNERAREDEGA
ncbi:MAG: hypothetical protein BWX84_02876 [Verrucomicrobia bacterium ADurb.Bin118]|nr:MAG: hypothetical protein BWX84_02876 [Verrucomicrobia bacterium ADurb.Bin118]